MKNKTAVDWLVNHFDEYGIDFGLLEPIIKQAKEIEKQQIIDAFEEGSLDIMHSQQYYEENFNQ